MAAVISHYLHTTLYAFDGDAKSEVKARFDAAMKDDSIKLSYYSATETFFVQCQSRQGAVADNELARILKEYIVEELEAAERENRAAHIVRFQQSHFDDLNILDEGSERQPEPSTHRRHTNPIARTEIILAPEGEAKVVKLFPLHDLQPYGLFDRCLAACTTKLQNLLNAGLVCRSARWSSTDGHIFNGRTGGCAKSTSTTHALQLPNFRVLVDEREGIVSAQEAEAKSWEFISGQEKTTVKQWLQGIGQTQQVTPDSRAEIPKEAKQLVAAQQTHAAGRARVPKGQSIMPADKPDSDAEGASDSDSDSEHDAFSSILPSKSAPSTSNASEIKTVIETKHGVKGNLSPSFASLFPGGNKSTQLQTSYGQVELQMDPSSDLYLARSTKSKSAVTAQDSGADRHANSMDQALIRSLEPAEHETSEGWGMDKRYAKVDTVGLSGHEINTAAWQNEHNVALDRRADKGKGSRLIPRHTPAILPPCRLGSSDGSQYQVSDPRKHSPQRSTCSTSRGTMPPSVLSARDLARTDAIWPPVRADTAHQSGRLVDNDGQQRECLGKGSNATKVPPGFDQPRAVGPKLPIQSKSHVVTGTLVDLGNTTADTNISEAPLAKLAGLRSGTVPLKTAKSSGSSASTSLGAESADDCIAESIQPLEKGFATKHNTMRQKSGPNTKKKKKGNKSKTQATNQKFKAQLELSEPPPPPKKKQKPPAETVHVASQARTSVTRPAEVADERSPLPYLKPSTRITRDNHAFGKALQHAIQMQELHEEDDYDQPQSCQSTKLVARLGLLLLKSKEIDRSATDPLTMQASLRELLPKTHFLQRLTTDETDAERVLNIAHHIGDPAVFQVSTARLELIIRETATGELLKVAFAAGDDQEGFKLLSIKRSEQVLGEANCHLTIHVWDTQICLVQPSADYQLASVSTIDDFMASMITDGTPPSFRAQTSSGVFTVEKVLSKRVVEVQKPGMTFRLTEVQELVCESLELGSYNFRALARSPQEMIEEQRYWFEAQWETSDLTRADELQAYANATVKEMDDIGARNEGPFKLAEDYRLDDESELEEAPFW